MSRMIIIDETPFDIRAARVEEEEIIRLGHVHKARKNPIRGTICKAKVKKIDKRLGAAYLDLGGADGFLRRQGNLPNVGESLLVEIKREGFGGKGPEVTDRAVLRLPLVTIPLGNAARLGPINSDEGVYEPIVARAEQLIEAGRAQPNLGPMQNIPAVAHLLTHLADGGVDEIHVASVGLKQALLPFIGDAIPIELVEARHVRGAIDAAEEEGLARTLDLSGGGRLTVDETEALFAVDLDLGRQDGQSKKGAAERLLTEALATLGHHALLADLGGQIVIDVPRAAIAAPKIIRDRLTRTFKPLGRVSVPAVTPEGMCVVIAPRPGPSLLERLTEHADVGVRSPQIWRRDVSAARAYRALEAALSSNKTAKIQLHCADRIASLFDEESEAIKMLSDQFGPRIRVQAGMDAPVGQEEFDVA